MGGPAEGLSHHFGSVPAAPTCTAEDAISGLASCVVTGYSTAIGSHTLSATATDNAGRTTTARRTYSVVYDFTGFFRPIDMGGVFNKVKAGQAVPVKFSLGGDQGMDILKGDPKAPTIKCDASAPADAVDETVAATKSSLSYDAASGQYTYVWKTDKGWAGQCRQLQVTLADGEVYTANFNFTK